MESKEMQEQSNFTEGIRSSLYFRKTTRKGDATWSFQPKGQTNWAYRLFSSPEGVEKFPGRSGTTW